MFRDINTIYQEAAEDERFVQSRDNLYYHVLMEFNKEFGLYGDWPDRHERAMKISSDMISEKNHKFRKKADALIPLLTPKRF